MENTMKMYVTADKAAQILGVSRGYEYRAVVKGQRTIEVLAIYQ